VNSFERVIYKIGINPVVDPPEDVLRYLFERAGRSKGPIAVRGTINGAPFVQTLVKYKGAWRLYINGIMLKAAAATVGDLARITIDIDTDPPVEQMPRQLADALSRQPSAAAEFDKLTPSRKKEILRYLNSLKSDAAIARNIEKVIKQLLGR
jgi:uncharacterized protein YdeI (YjbR/CyaY-like superfamily)